MCAYNLLNKLTKYSLILVLLFAMAEHVTGQDNSPSAGLDFLNIGPNARTLGLSEAYAASLNGAADIYTNPANQVFEPSSSIGANFTLWITDSQISHASANFKKKNHAFGFGVISSNLTGFEARTQPGPSNGDFSINYLSVAGSFAYKLGNYAAGATIQFLNEDFLEDNASGFAFNFGLSGNWFDDRIRTGFVIQNAGEMGELNEVSTQLPTNFRVGIKADLIKFTTSDAYGNIPVLLRVYGDFIEPLFDEIDNSTITVDQADARFNIGTSVLFADMFDLRFGFNSDDSARKFSSGFGVNYESFRFNYAVVPFEVGFDTVHSFGLEYFF